MNKDLRFTGKKPGAECIEQNGAPLVSPNYSVVKPVQQLAFLSNIDLHMGIWSGPDGHVRPHENTQNIHVKCSSENQKVLCTSDLYSTYVFYR